MSKMYVDLEQLEKLFSEYDIPYTFIFEELQNYSAEEVADSLSVHDLRTVLEKKHEVFATQVWQKEDIKAAMNTLGVKPDVETIARIMSHAKAPLEDCSDNWDKLHAAIKDCLK